MICVYNNDQNYIKEHNNILHFSAKHYHKEQIILAPAIASNTKVQMDSINASSSVLISVIKTIATFSFSW